jgi:hypothetical protein
MVTSMSEWSVFQESLSLALGIIPGHLPVFYYYV